MIILGIDPGTHRIGYGAIESAHGACRYISAGILPVGRAAPPAQLHNIKSRLDALIDNLHPSTVALETLYFAKNRKTGIAVAQARGVILLAAAEHNLPVAEFSPNEMKAHLTGYGLADKASVAKMVRIALKFPTLRIIDDASDALALALTAHFTKRLGG